MRKESVRTANGRTDCCLCPFPNKGGMRVLLVNNDNQVARAHFDCLVKHPQQNLNLMRKEIP